LGFLTIPQAAEKLYRLIDKIKPDVVHAMRIPYEGMLAAAALANTPKPPLIISVWGNDFTLHARSNPWMGRYTRLAMQRANGLHTDCFRDRNLAYNWEYSQANPVVVLPGNGGVQKDIFYPPAAPAADREHTLIQPRGFRAYVRNDTFFKAIHILLEKRPDLKILCPGMAGEPQAISWAGKLGLSEAVELLPKVDRSTMADLFRRSVIAISPTTHDGTPNTLLEAMACGCFPVAGDLESIREWIDSGSNGLLFDPGSPEALAEAVLVGLTQREMRVQAAAINDQLVMHRADYSKVMEAAYHFYQGINQ
jgi:glycosyltransferase involved in cell wall biosynthesis